MSALANEEAKNPLLIILSQMHRIVYGVTRCTVLLKKKMHRFLHTQTGVKKWRHNVCNIHSFFFFRQKWRAQ